MFDIRTLLSKAEAALSLISAEPYINLTVIVHSVRCKALDLSQRKVSLLLMEQEAHAKMAGDLFPMSTARTSDACRAIFIQRTAEQAAGVVKQVASDLNHVDDLSQFVDKRAEERSQNNGAAERVQDNLFALNQLLKLREADFEALSVLWWCLVDATFAEIDVIHKEAVARNDAGTEDMKKATMLRPEQHAHPNTFFSDVVDRTMASSAVANIDLALAAANFRDVMHTDKMLMELVALEDKAHSLVPHGFLKHVNFRCGVFSVSQYRLEKADLEVLKKPFAAPPTVILSGEDDDDNDEGEGEEEKE